MLSNPLWLWIYADIHQYSNLHHNQIERRLTLTGSKKLIIFVEIL